MDITISELLDDPELIEVARKHMEDVLISWRNDRLSELGCGNGFAVCEKDGRGQAALIRIRTDHGFRIMLRAILDWDGTRSSK